MTLQLEGPLPALDAGHGLQKIRHNANQSSLPFGKPSVAFCVYTEIASAPKKVVTTS
jgi:hypothetical protein